MNDKEKVLKLLKDKEQIINQYVPNFIQKLKDTEDKLKNDEISGDEAIVSYTSLCVQIACRKDGEQ